MKKLALGIAGLVSIFVTTLPAGSLDYLVRGQWPGYARGFSDYPGLAIAGNYAFVADGDLLVADISNPENPQWVTGFSVGGHARGVAVVGHYAYVVDSVNGFQAIDIAEPARPQRVGRLDVSRSLSSIYLLGTFQSGRYAIVGGKSKLAIIDVGDPREPNLLSVSAFEFAPGTMAVSGNYAYGANGLGALQVVDLSNPAAPQFVSSVTNKVSSNLAFVGQYALAADTQFRVFDVSNPTLPQLVGVAAAYGPGFRVAVSGDYGYLLQNQNLLAFDIRNPVQPQKVSLLHSNPALGWSNAPLALEGSYAYIADSDGLRVVDVHDPTKPRLAGFLGLGSAYDVVEAGRFAFVADGWQGLEAFDISDPGHPQRVGQYVPGELSKSVALAGHFAYLSGGTNGLRIIDNSDPSRMQQVTQYRPPRVASVDAVTVSGRYARINSFSKLEFFDIINPTEPKPVPTTNSLGDQRVVIAGDYASKVASDTWTLYDIGNPHQIEEVITLQLSIRAGIDKGVTAGGYAYLLSMHGIDVFDIRVLAQPLELRFIPLRWYSDDMTVGGDCLYVPVSVPPAGLHVIDVSVPASPREVGLIATGVGHPIRVQGDHVYLLLGPEGFKILDRYDIQPFRFTSAPSFDGAHWRIPFAATPGKSFRLQRSRDLKFWEDWKSLGSTDGVQVIVDDALAEPKVQFYRAIEH